jgi:SEC-C motif-containing protein
VLPGAWYPCGSGTSYDACCGPLHRREAEAATAEQLMRSRYTAFVVGDTDHLFRSWHPRTRPDDVALDGTRWTGLEILDVVAGGPEDTDGVVEFVASHSEGKMRERSAFTRRRGRWVYVGPAAAPSPEAR